jgi:uncharacterized protein (TIGR02145 family)
MYKYITFGSIRLIYNINLYPPDMKHLIFTIALIGLSAPALWAQTHSISGYLTYNNVANTPLDVVKVVLKLNNNPIDSTVTNALGFYHFTGLPDNTYTLEAYTSKPWSGLNGTDAINVQRHFVGLELLTVPVRLTAADVNNSGSINGTDALKIKRRFVGLDSTFNRGDWVFEKVSGGNAITVAGADVTQDFYGLCVGDVNGSNTPNPTQELPTVNTANVSDIRIGSATSGGNVFSDGGLTVSAKGVCWSASPMPTVTGSYTVDGSGLGAYVSRLTGLLPGVPYYVRAYATNSFGTAYGNQVEFSAYTPQPCPNVPTVTYGGKIYNTVLIGNQCWLKENLNIGTRIDGSQDQTDNGNIEKYCPNDLESNCDLYGGLYQWNEAVQYSTVEHVQGICPTGWRIPTDADWCALTVFLDATVNCNNIGWGGIDAGGKLKAAGNTYWASPNTGATNSSGFTALPAGFNGGGFAYLSTNAIFWSSTQSNSISAWYRNLENDLNQADRSNNPKTFGMSIRCIRDTCSSYSPTGVLINPSINPACSGSSVTFTATPANGGSAPFYQWMVNGAIVGTNSPIYSYSPANGDSILCVMTSSAPCALNPATSNKITMIVNPGPGPATPLPGTHIPSQTRIVWKWNSAPGATGYKWNTTNNYSTAIDMGGTLSLTETGLSCDSTYTRYVWSYNSSCTSASLTINQSTSACAVFSCGQSITDPRDAQNYNTVQIGTQCWLQQNLNYSVSSYSSFCYYNMPSNCDVYGKLYNPVYCNITNVCMPGWHTPSDAEWTALINYLGGSDVAGGKMKESGTAHWISPNTGATNESGFTGLPGGDATYIADKSINYNFWDLGTAASFWTSTGSGYGDGYWGKRLSYSNDDVSTVEGHMQWPLEDAWSIRCVYQGCPSMVPPSPGTHSPSNSQIIWNWNTVPNATGYKWNTTMDYSTATNMGTSISKTDTGLACNTNYNRYVWAYNSCGDASAATCLTQSTISNPSAPTAGTHTPGPSTIIWKWNSVTGATGYKWSTSNDFLNATDMGTSLSKTEPGLNCATAYTRYLWAYCSCGFSTVTILTQSTQSCTFTCGQTLFDDRDSKTYPTVLINSQCWMRKNLNYGTKIPMTQNQANNSIPEKYCYMNYESVCDDYGGLYQWGEMVQYLYGASNTTSWNPVPSGNVPGLCPNGWYIPSQADWMSLITYVGGLAYAGGNLKETGYLHWFGPNEGATNAVGFTGLPGGNTNPDGSFPNSLQYYANFWSSTELSSTNARSYALSTYSANAGSNSYNKSYGFSIRCVYQGCPSMIPPSPGTHTPSTSQIIWNWNQVPNAAGYKWNTTMDYSTATDLGTNLSKTETGLACNTNYSRYVWAYNSCGNASTATCLTQSTSVNPSSPSAGTHIPGPSTIIWSWNAVSGATGYKWSTTNDFLTATDMGTSLSKTETGLNCGTPYTRYLWAYNSCEPSTVTTLTQSTQSCTFTCGQTLFDDRDSRTYPTVLINSKCWISKNLNYGTKIPGSQEQTNNSIPEKYCIQDYESNCDVYGGLYQWGEIVQYLNGASNTTSWNPIPTGNVTGLCPNGWHIPTYAEWSSLITYAGGSNSAGGKLKETGYSHWLSPNTGATNAYGFTALPDGLRGPGGTFIDFQTGAFFLTSSEYDATGSWSYQLYYNTAQAYSGIESKSEGFSVRCIKD